MSLLHTGCHCSVEELEVIYIRRQQVGVNNAIRVYYIGFLLSESYMVIKGLVS